VIPNKYLFGYIS